MRRSSSFLVRVLAVLAGLAFAALTIVAPAGPATAAEADGCSGDATSFTEAGEELDLVLAPGLGGTLDRPFVIDTRGTVQWSGGTDAVITNGTWSVSVGGWPVSEGSFDNDDRVQSSQGEYKLSDLPDAVSLALGALGESKIPVSATVTGNGGTCTASGYVTGMGSPFASPLFYSGLALILVAFLMFLFMLLALFG